MGGGIVLYAPLLAGQKYTGITDYKARRTSERPWAMNVCIVIYVQKRTFSYSLTLEAVSYLQEREEKAAAIYLTPTMCKIHSSPIKS